MIFARETVADVWDEALPLLALHNREVPIIEGMPADPDRAAWERIDKAGALALFVIREPAACALVGYAVHLVWEHLHYRGKIWAVQDLLYVLPAYRGRTAVRFLQFCDERLTDIRCSVVLRHVVDVDFSRTLERMGYTACERGYLRRLNE